MMVTGRPYVAKLVTGEFFVIFNYEKPIDLIVGTIHVKRSYIYKISGTGGVGDGMWYLPSGSDYLGYYIIGRQKFNDWVTAIEYAEGQTIIGFEDGRLLKIYGTGGLGYNMFNIYQVPDGFLQQNMSITNHLVGSHKFKKPIIEVAYIGGQTLVCFKNSKILKVNGTGGAGLNVFAIIETTNTFSSVVGYTYYVGYQKGNSDVTNITVLGTNTFIAFRDGRHIKLHGTGSGGANMFAITEQSYGYSSVAGYNYLLGSMKYQSYIVKGLVIGGVTFFSLRDGRIMKIKGAGGTGQNMFNIFEIPDGFDDYNPSGTLYRYGDYQFKSLNYNIHHYVIDMKYINGNLMLVLNAGHIVKILNTGGTGHHMFNIVYGWDPVNSIYNYHTYLTGETGYLLGNQVMYQHSAYPGQIIQFGDDGLVFFCYNHGDYQAGYVVKLQNSGSNHFKDMFGITIIISCYKVNPVLPPGQISSFVGCQKVAGD